MQNAINESACGARARACVYMLSSYLSSISHVLYSRSPRVRALPVCAPEGNTERPKCKTSTACASTPLRIARRGGVAWECLESFVRVFNGLSIERQCS